MKISSFLLSFFCLVLLSCNNENNQPNLCTLNSANLSGVYMITSQTIQADSLAPVTEVFPTWADCEQDNIYNLQASGTFEFSEGILPCSNPPISETGTWNLSGNTLSLTYSNGGVTVNPIISNFDCISFKANDYNVSNGRRTVTTYTKQ